MKRIIMMACVVAMACPSYAQISKALDKAKEKQEEMKNNKEDKEDAGSDNAAGSSDNASGNSSGTEDKQPAKPAKGADGYLINDPAVAAYFQGKQKYFSTDIKYSSILIKYNGSFKMAGATVEMKDDTLHVFLVAQDKYGGTVTNMLDFGKLGLYYYEKKNRSYAYVEPDGSILMFGTLTGAALGELISMDSTQIASAVPAKLNAEATEHMKKVKQEENNAEAARRKAANEKYYSEGNVIAGHTDAAMESKVLKILNDANKDPNIRPADRVTYSKVLLLSQDWYVVKNDYDIIVKQAYAAWAIGAYTSDGACFFQKVWLKKEYLGGGVYGDPKYDTGEVPSIVDCSILK